MQLSAIVLARVLCFAELSEFNPRGEVFLPGLVPELVERFSFQSFPTKPEEFDLVKGVNFFTGYWSGSTVSKITFFNDGIILDGLSSTTESRSILLSTLEWLRDDHGIEFSMDKIKRWGYLSNLSFYSDADLTLLHPVLAHACERLGEMSKYLERTPFPYKVTRIALDFDKNEAKITRAPFSIERLNSARFNDQKYLSEAALPTELHLELLKEIEAGILGQT